MLSNVAVAATTGVLADRPFVLFRTLRLDGLVAITVTGVVFHLALSDLQELTGWSAFADFVLHTVSPFLAVVGWGVFGPRGALSPRIVLLSVVAPVTWIAYTLIRGANVQDRFGDDYYPYPFMNVPVHGLSGGADRRVDRRGALPDGLLRRPRTRPPARRGEGPSGIGAVARTCIAPAGDAIHVT